MLTIDGFDSVKRTLESKLVNVESACTKALKAGAKVLKGAYKQRLSTQNVSGESHHELENSFIVEPVTYSVGDGYHTKVKPDGYDSKGQPLPEIGWVLEYGRGSNHEAMYPWMAPTNELTKRDVREAERNAMLEEMAKK